MNFREQQNCKKGMGCVFGYTDCSESTNWEKAEEYGGKYSGLLIGNTPDIFRDVSVYYAAKPYLDKGHQSNYAVIA